MRIPGGGTHLDHPVADVQDAHVERATAEVEDEHRLVLLLVQAVGQRRGGRLIDDAQHLEAGDPASVLGCLPLRVIEVGGNRDHGLRHPLAEEFPRILSELAQYERADLLRGVQLAPYVEPSRPIGTRNDVEPDRLGLFRDLLVAAANEPLRGIDRALGVEDRLAAGQLAHEPLAAVREPHHRGGRA
jgi:NAD-dependent glutamate dehydrogenase